MKKRDLLAMIEAQASEIAALRGRIGALEARPVYVISPEPYKPPYDITWTGAPLPPETVRVTSG